MASFPVSPLRHKVCSTLWPLRHHDWNRWLRLLHFLSPTTAALNLVTLRDRFFFCFVFLMCICGNAQKMQGIQSAVCVCECVCVFVESGEETGETGGWAVWNVNSVLCSLWLLGCCYHNMSHHRCITTFERPTASLEKRAGGKQDVQVGPLSVRGHMTSVYVILYRATILYPYCHRLHKWSYIS